MRTRSHAFSLILGFALAGPLGCKGDPGKEGASCKEKSDCASGLSCVDGKCSNLDGGEDTPTGYCATVAALEGEWTFDATVVGAETLAPRGINGHYQLIVTTKDCEATAHLTKTGHDKVEYSDKKIQRAEATLVESSNIPLAAEATFALRKEQPSHTMTFVVEGDELFGWYHWTEANWKRQGMWGYLRGVRRGEELVDVEVFDDQPCAVACLVDCDVARRTADENLDQAGLDACMSACDAGERTVGCGAGEALPEALTLATNGPASDFDALCSKASAAVIARGGGASGATVSCETKPTIKGKPTERGLGKRQLNGSFLSAKVVQIGYLSNEDYTGELVLALETEDGWYWTDAIADLSSSTAAGITREVRSLGIRAREMVADPGREVVLEFSTKVSDSDLAKNEIAIDETSGAVVCALGAAPKCMQVTTAWSSERSLIDPKAENAAADNPDLGERSGEVYFAILPGDRISISTDPDARSADRELAGIYAW